MFKSVVSRKGLNTDRYLLKFFMMKNTFYFCTFVEFRLMLKLLNCLVRAHQICWNRDMTPTAGTMTSTTSTPTITWGVIVCTLAFRIRWGSGAINRICSSAFIRSAKRCSNGIDIPSWYTVVLICATKTTYRLIKFVTWSANTTACPTATTLGIRLYIIM